MKRKAYYSTQERELASLLPQGSGIDYDWSFSIGNDGKSVIAENEWHYMDSGIPFMVKLDSDGSVDNISINVDDLKNSDLGADISTSFYSDEPDFDDDLDDEKASSLNVNQKNSIIENEVNGIIDHLYAVFEGVNSVQLGEAVRNYIADDEIVDLPKTASRRRIAADDDGEDDEEDKKENDEMKDVNEVQVVTFKTSDKALIDLLKGDFAEITIATDDDEQTFGPESFGDLKVSDDTETKKTASISRKADKKPEDKDVFTVHMSNETEDYSLESDPVVTAIYYDENEAIEAAKGLLNKYMDDEDEWVVSVFAGEYEKPSGAIWGEPFDIWSESNKKGKKTASISRKADIEMLKPGALSTALGPAPNKYFALVENQLVEAGVPQNNATGIKEWLQGACEGLETVDNTLGKTERDFNSLAESYKSAADYCTNELKQAASSKVFASYFSKAAELFKKAAAKFAAK